MKFELEQTDSWSAARAGSVTTSHGVFETPIFMPVATQAVLRGVDTAVVEQLGYQVLLANTFHLLLRPGPRLFERVGGIHRFMHWPRSVLTDSGGFQIFSLSKSLVMSEEGARFRSYVDGSEVMLTPETSIKMQGAIGSDIMMVLDHCINSTSDRAATEAALALTTRWAKRSLAARAPDSTQALFGIVQGACFPDLRKESAKQITALPFDGFAIGGLAVGESKAEREDMVEFTAPLLPRDKPRYLMGVGTPIDLLEAVKRGVDMFDCILPTSLAHQGVCFTSNGKLDLRRTIYRDSDDALDSKCECSTCKRFSRAYLHHLRRTDEHVGHQLMSVHNLTFYKRLMEAIRASIIAGNFRAFYEANRPLLMESDTINPGKPAVARPRANPTLGDYEVVTVEDPARADRAGRPYRYGAIRQISSGETMHSVSEPAIEAKSLYYEQSNLLERARTMTEVPLTVWDVGLGAATNVMVAVLELEAAGGLGRPVEFVSFECDTDSLRLATKHPELFRHLRHQAPHQLLERGEWTSKTHPITWRLIPGDIREVFQRHQLTPIFRPAEIIWFDPFSYKVDGVLWQLPFLTTLRELVSNEKGAHSPRRIAELYTYSSSTAVRAGLLAAGWFVAAGRGTDQKLETTIAYSERPGDDKFSKLLGASWLKRWERSDARLPLGIEDRNILERIGAHDQFKESLNAEGPRAEV
jgi:queuine tRNA-ribosyltransferase